METRKRCPICEEKSEETLDRREFMWQASTVAAVAAAGTLPVWPVPSAQGAPTPQSPAEAAVAALYQSFSEEQKRQVCFDWDYRETTGRRRGLLRTFISANWHITPHTISSDFYTPQQRSIIHDIFRSIYNPDWYNRIMRQIRDDTNGRPWGAAQNIAIFGQPGSPHCEFVMTGRHLTIRADANTTPHVAFGGPIFYGHAASGFHEKPGHPGNIFWEQGRRANLVFRMLDERQRRLALLDQRPEEQAVAFRGANRPYPGIPVTELSRDQKEELQRILQCLLEPYRREDQEEARACLQQQGGLDRCSLAFYRDGDIGNDQEWDNWRLEGPAFVWYFRGEPHVHVWVNVADDPTIPFNTRG